MAGKLFLGKTKLIDWEQGHELGLENYKNVHVDEYWKLTEDYKYPILYHNHIYEVYPNRVLYSRWKPILLQIIEWKKQKFEVIFDPEFEWKYDKRKKYRGDEYLHEGIVFTTFEYEDDGPVQVVTWNYLCNQSGENVNLLILKEGKFI